MKWCCKVFQGWLGEAGKRGIGVFVAIEGDSDPAFILQYRALDEEAPVPHTPFPLSSVSEVNINFCPWCGANLKKSYRDSFRELDRSELRVPL